MTVVVESAAIQRDGATYAQVYVYTAGNDENVRDANHAVELARTLVGDDGVFVDGAPPESATTIFRIFITVTCTRKRKSNYRMEYKRYAFEQAYNPPVQAMMELYHELRRIYKKAREAVK